MTAHQVTAQRIACPQARLQVHARAGLTRAQRRLGHGLARYIGVEHRALEPCHGEANALHAHTVADRDSLYIERRGVDSQLQVAALLEYRDQAPCRHNNPGEHLQDPLGVGAAESALLGIKMSRRSAPMRCWLANSNAGSGLSARKPLNAVSGAASAPSRIGATYRISSSTNPASRNAPASRGPHSTKSSLSSRAVNRAMTASRSNRRPVAATRSTSTGGILKGK